MGTHYPFGVLGKYPKGPNGICMGGLTGKLTDVGAILSRYRGDPSFNSPVDLCNVGADRNDNS